MDFPQSHISFGQTGIPDPYTPSTNIFNTAVVPNSMPLPMRPPTFKSSFEISISQLAQHGFRIMELIDSDLLSSRQDAMLDQVFF